MRPHLIKTILRTPIYHYVSRKHYSVLQPALSSGKRCKSVALAGLLTGATVLAYQQDFISYNYQDQVDNDDFVSLKDYLLKDAQRVLRYDQVSYPTKKGKMIQPLVTFFPETQEDLKRILVLCNRYGMPIVIAQENSPLTFPERDFVQVNLSRLGRYTINQTHQII